MPLHLAPMSRRRFLASTLAAGVGLWTWRPARGDEPSGDPDRWALLADTHIAADRAHVRQGVNMVDHLARVVCELTALDPRPAAVLVDGDAAFQQGTPGDYGLLGELLKPLVDARLPVHLTLGNHDHRENFRTGLKQGAGASPLASRCVAVVETPRVNWFLLDSLDRTNVSPGVVGKEQLDWLAEVLDARAEKPALVAVHHDPQWTPPAKRGGLMDTEALFAVLTPRKQVKAVIYGHTHVWQHSRRDGIHLVNLPPVAYTFTPGPPSGWVDLKLANGGAELTLHALDAQHRQNGERVELTWR